MKDYARIAKPLYALLNKNSKFVWSSSCQESFDVDDPAESFHVTIDASKDGYGLRSHSQPDGRREEKSLCILLQERATLQEGVGSN